MLWKIAFPFTQFTLKILYSIIKKIEKMPKRKTKFLIYFGFEKLNVMENTMSVYTIYIKNILHKII
jgi:hypothetical protein